MLFLSGFKLYSRWVPLFPFDNLYRLLDSHLAVVFCTRLSYPEEFVSGPFKEMFRRLPSISFVILLLSRVLINFTRLAPLSGHALLMGIVSAISTMFKSTRREHEK